VLARDLAGDRRRRVDGEHVPRTRDTPISARYADPDHLAGEMLFPPLITVDPRRLASQAKTLTIPLRPGGQAAVSLGDPETARRPRVPRGLLVMGC